MEVHIEQQGRSHIDNADRNRRVILNIIRERAPITRRAVAEVCSLSMSTTKRLLEALLQERVVREEAGGVRPGQEVRRGRKAQALSLNPAFAHALGVNIEPGVLEFCVVDLAGEPLVQRRVPLTDPSSAAGQADRIIAMLVGEVRQLAHSLRREGRGQLASGNLLGVGVGVAGVINAREGQVLFCPNLAGWENLPLAERLRGELHADVLVDDGVRCLTLAEKRYGLARGLTNFLFIYIGRGVGAGIVLDNRFYRGSNGFSGEFGHITVANDGPLCNCGNRGCLEALVSRNGILSSVRSMVASNVYTNLAAHLRAGGELSLRDIEEAAEGGDKLANMVIHGVGESIGTGVADLVNIFDPGVVVLGGEVITHFGDHLIEGINRTVRLRGIHSITQKTRILTSRLGMPVARENGATEDGPGGVSPGARGAATMLIERFLGSDILNL